MRTLKENKEIFKIKPINQAILMFSLLVFFLNEISLFLFLPYKIRLSFELISFFLDCVLCLSFLLKTVYHLRYKTFFIYCRGELWIDLLSSLIVIIFYSLPFMLLSFSSPLFYNSSSENGPFWQILFFYTAKYLRLLRFSQLAFTLLPQQNQTGRSLIYIERIFTFSFLIPFSLFIFLNFFLKPFGKSSFCDFYIPKSSLYDASKIPLNEIRKNFPFLLEIKNLETDKSPYIRSVYWKSEYGPYDYFPIIKNNIVFFIDQKPLVQEQAKEGIFFFFLNFMIFLSLFRLNNFLLKAFIYPINVIYKGMTDPLEYRRVDIPSMLREDPVFRLSREFNNKNLPEKLKKPPLSRIPFVPKDLQKIFQNNKE